MNRITSAVSLTWLAVSLACIAGAGCGLREQADAEKAVVVPQSKPAFSDEAAGRVQPATGLTGGRGSSEPPVTISPLPLSEMSDDFESGALDGRKWMVTRTNDFSEFGVDVAPLEGEAKNNRLRLRCATIGTDDSTVKFLGVVSRSPLDLSGRKSLEVDLDWNNQANGCYLTAGIFLCPVLTAGNPADQPLWLKVEYCGVPPGKNARASVWFKDRFGPHCIYDEGWPDKQRVGRPVGKVHIEVRLDGGVLTLLEDGRELFVSKGKDGLQFECGYLYLQMSSHSNYRAREIFFDNVRFGRAGGTDGG